MRRGRLIVSRVGPGVVAGRTIGDQEVRLLYITRNNVRKKAKM